MSIVALILIIGRLMFVTKVRIKRKIGTHELFWKAWVSCLNLVSYDDKCTNFVTQIYFIYCC